jgi:methyl-accepting chemotaxis protein
MKSLQTKIILVFTLLFLLFGAVLGFRLYTSSASLIAESVGEQAKAVAQQAVKVIDLAQYATIDPGKEPNAYYHQLRQQLNDIRETNNLKYLYTMARVKDGGKDQYIYIVDGAAPNEKDSSDLGEPEENEYEGLGLLFETGKAQVGEMDVDPEYGATVTAYVPIRSAQGELIGLMGADFDATSIHEVLKQHETDLIIYFSVAMVIVVLFILGFSMYLFRPLRRLTSEVRQVGKGNLTVDLSLGKKRKDEIGELASVFNQVIAELRSIIRGIADGSAVLHELSTQLDAGAQQASASTEKVANSVMSAAKAAEIQADRTTDTLRAVEEVASGMQRIAESSTEMNEASHQTSESARGGDRYIRQARADMHELRGVSLRSVELMEKLVESSREIGQITNVMTGIAQRTNILALNAGIESTRAGEAGKGFAVVAEEIRKLASQSMDASVRISELIEAVQLGTDQASSVMNEAMNKMEISLRVVDQAGEAFERILSNLENTVTQIEDVSAVSEEVAAGSEEVNASVDEMRRLNEQYAESYLTIAEAADNQRQTVAELAKLAGKLNSTTEKLHSMVQHFQV